MISTEVCTCPTTGVPLYVYDLVCGLGILCKQCELWMLYVRAGKRLLIFKKRKKITDNVFHIVTMVESNTCLLNLVCWSRV